jgi:D-inositol-3-phosphate glycosyltransferase
MKIKVLMLDIRGYGGIAHYTYNLMQALVESGEFDCTLLTDQEYELEVLPRSFTVIKQPLKNGAYLAAISRIIKTVFSVKPKIIHIQAVITVRRDWIWFILSRLFGLRIVFTAHNVLPHEEREQKAFFMKSALKIIYACSDKIIVHSQYSRNRLLEFFKIDPGKIAVIPHGNYLFLRTREVSKQQACRELDIAADKKVILHFGSLRHYKGIDILLEAFRKIRDLRSDVLLLLAGKPMHVPSGYFEELIRKTGMSNDVILKAEYIPLDKIQVYFYASDIVVLAYKEIDTSGSLQLAYAFAKPVVATRTGSMAEVFEDGKNGLLVSAEDPLALADAVNKVLFDDALLEQMGNHSFRLAKDRFDWDAIAARTISLYSELR